jgi:hypothetical protein
VRPHDIDVRREPNGSAERATVERVVHLGFEVRADLALPGCQTGSVVATRPFRRLNSTVAATTAPVTKITGTQTS